jgi:cytosine/adenosine deaminase-related metal-dependent hydrolase
MATVSGATIMGVSDYGLKAGGRADLVLLEGETLSEAIVKRAPRPYVIKNGRVVASGGTCLV